jgi:hypothetical protein
MTDPARRQMILEATETVLDRLDTHQLGAPLKTDLTAIESHEGDVEFFRALWSTSFGVAWYLLDRLTQLDPADAADQMVWFRNELAAYRSE